MDTPGRRMTRSQMSTLGPSSAGKPLGRVVGSSKKKEISRTPFTDLTNDSPISGLMPAKLAASAGCVYESTPRSKLRPADRPIGEDLLRMQVTSLLRKVESEALIHQKKNLPPTADMFESPMRLAAPTPANTPAAGVPGLESKAAILPPIVVASPVGHLDASSKLERMSPAFVSTAELLSSLEQTFAVESGGVATGHQEESTTRTLKFDSPERQVPAVEEESTVEAPTPASVSTTEILSSIEEMSASIDNGMDGLVEESTTRALQFDSPSKNALPSEAQLGYRVLRFESPNKKVPDVEIVCELFSPSAHPHPRVTATEEEDSWSVIVNVHTPDKLEGGDSQLVDVPTSSEVDSETMEFIQNVLVDPEITPRVEIPALWERRDTPALKSGLKDDDDYEDCEEYEGYEEEEEEEDDEAYVDGTDAFDEVCDELCKGLSTINMGEGPSRGLPAFQGKHTRFTYNSDDEIEEDVVTDKTKTMDSPGKLKLIGVPTPKGKHIRFNDEGQSDQEV